MLNSKAIAKTLQNSMCPGIENIFLVNKAGALVLAANNHEAVKTLGAILSNIWSDYDSCMGNADSGELLKSMIIQCENGCVSIENVANMYLCVQGGNEVGKILEVAKRLKEILEPPLLEALST